MGFSSSVQEWDENQIYNSHYKSLYNSAYVKDVYFKWENGLHTNLDTK